MRSSPLVRRMAREKGIDLGAGARHGHRRTHQQEATFWRIEHGRRRAAGAAPSTRTTARAPAARAAAAGAGVPRERIYFGRYQVQPMSAMRQKIAEHMVMSKRVSPHVYSIDEADVTGIVAHCARR